MQQIAEWLERLGMSEYARCFSENRIDFSVLRDLTDQDLKDLGVVLGDRRKMLRAIGELGAVSPAGPAISTDPLLLDAAERRQVTVMFSDLVGSTALSACMDPEDLREVISAYQKSVADTVRRFGGFVARYLGDGVLVYFGYPQAHEDDAERAVRAGLALIAAVAGLKTLALLQTRVGIATGIVVVGDMLESGEAQERAIVGETPNLAARLQALAEPDTVVIAESTRKLLGNLFEFRDLGARELKGIAGPVRVWAALRASSVESRFDAVHQHGLTELVGRDEESELLLRRWSGAEVGEGQVVLLSGEAGIGKSRLAVALLERLASEPHTRLRYFCSPRHTDTALYPFIGQMERAAGLAYDDALQARLDKLDALLAQTSTSIEDAALFAEMLSLPNDGRYPALDLDPQQRRQRTLEALVLQFAALTRSKPVLMILEDAHWIDPTSLEVLSRAVDRLRTLRLLLIVTFRPEFDPPWIGRHYVTALHINRLAERDAGAMIDSIVRNKFIPERLRQDIIERTDGIPLFIEEMINAVLETDCQRVAERTIAVIPTSALAVPASLHALLMARLDRLGPAKEVAQIGAALGRGFSHALLAAVVRKPEMQLMSALDRLIAAGLLFRQGVPPHATYVFKHALVQDAAYGTLLREPRRALHALIAERLETQFPEIAESQPELLARHCSAGGLIEKAARLWGKAGQRSMARSALLEAAEQLTRAIGHIATLTPSPALRRDQIKLQVALTNSLMLTKGSAALETKVSLDQARSLIEQADALGEPLEDPLLLFSVLYSFWAANQRTFNGDEMLNLATQFMALAEKQGATAPLMIGNRLMGSSLMSTGDIQKGMAHLDRAIALYDPHADRVLGTQFGCDIRVSALCYRSIGSWILGYPETALADAHYALKEAREIEEAATLMFTLNLTILTHIFRGDHAAATTQYDQLVVLAGEKGASFRKATGMAKQGCALALAGKASDAIQMITSGISALRSTGTIIWMPLYLSHLARAHADLGQFPDAWRCISEAIVAVETTKEKWCEAEVNRVAGEIALMPTEPNESRSQAHFERALAVAREQNAKSWELRAAMSMARRWCDQGNQQQAHDLLAPIFGWFTEGFDTLELKQAKALLDQLASSTRLRRAGACTEQRAIAKVATGLPNVRSSG
jgi:class 3 adenylate cyclase/predicted ATPase